MNKTIIISGSTGFIGRYLVRAFLQNEYRVYAIVRTKEREKDLIDFLKLTGVSDISLLSFVFTDLEVIHPDVFPHEEYDAWFHLAWEGVNREQVNSEAVQKKNVLFSKKSLLCANALGCSFFGDFGSRAEYPDGADIIEELMPEHALNEYGNKKKEFYKYATRFCEEAEMKYVHFRIFSVFGPYDHPWSLMMTACRNFVLNKPMEFGTCTQIWNYLDVRDLTDAVVRIYRVIINEPSKIKNGKIINLGSSISRPLKEYIYEVHDICKSFSKMTFGTKEGFSSKPKLDTIKKLGINYQETPFQKTVLDILESISNEA